MIFNNSTANCLADEIADQNRQILLAAAAAAAVVNQNSYNLHNNPILNPHNFASNNKISYQN